MVGRNGYANPQAAFEAKDKKEFILIDVETGNRTWKDRTFGPR